MTVYAAVFAGCTALFALRVAGQAIVVIAAPNWLSSMEHWYSGLLPYRYLLPAQLALMVVIAVDLFRGVGPFASDWWRGGANVMVALASIYFFSMVLRYMITMALKPEFRWLRRTIPIWFHLVLATALWGFADHHLS